MPRGRSTLTFFVAALLASPSSASATTCRDRFLWPFAETSIWNTPIGSSAEYVDANIYPTAADLPVEIHNDQEWIIQSQPSDPYVDWIDDSNNFPGGCGAKGPVAPQKMPLPASLVTDCVDNNNSAGVLLPDNITLVQMQPFYRPAAGGPMIAWYHTGAPQPFPWEMSILDNGTYGSHGGSGLSGVGGSIRVGELLPGAPPISHALKLELWAHRYYFYNYTSGNYSTCYTWPAIGCDSYYNLPGPGYNGTLPYLKPGALLAVPPARQAEVAAKLATVVGQKLLQALVDYGGYIVDDTGSEEGGGALCMESGVNAEIKAQYGWSVAIEDPLTQQQGAPLYWDLVAIFRALAVVVNNGPNSIGGGGTPRRPPPPPIC